VLDTTPLTAAVDRLADRLRGAPQSKLQRGAAAQALALARELSVRAQRLEAADAASGAGGAGGEPRIMPDAGVFAVADQLTVAAVDLAEALRTAPSVVELDEAVRSVERVATTSRL
jgi:acetyl-CoA acetyltransferase